MSQPIETCKNCEKEFQHDFEFCPHCGQKAKDDLTLGVLFYNTIANYFSFDARFLKSFFPLLFRPGYLAARFIEGKRLLYLHPAQLYLFVSVIFFFVLSFSVRESARDLDKNLAKTLKTRNALDTITDDRVRDSIRQAKRDERRRKDSIGIAQARKGLKESQKWTGMSDAQIDSILASDKFSIKNNDNDFNFSGLDEDVIDSLLIEGATDEEIYKAMGMDDNDGWLTKKFYKQGLKFYKSRQGGSILQAFYDTIPIAMFFLLPIFAFILKLFYFNKGRYAHHLVFSFYFFSFLFTVFAIMFGVNRFWDIPDWIDWLIALSTFFYLFFALKRFYQQWWFLTLIKSGIVTFVFILVIIPVTAVLLGVFAFLFY